MRLTPSQAALVGLAERYQRAGLDPFLTIRAVHKLLYFLQAAGETLGLAFAHGRYGPQARSLRPVLGEGPAMLLPDRFEAIGEADAVPLQLAPGSVPAAQRVLRQTPDTRNRLNRVVALMEGFESAFGLTLLAVVHWVLNRKLSASGEDLASRLKTHNFSRRQIRLAADILNKQGWVPPITAMQPDSKSA